MSGKNTQKIPETQTPRPLTEEKGLQPATRPPQMPNVRPPKQEKTN